MHYVSVNLSQERILFYYRAALLTTFSMEASKSSETNGGNIIDKGADSVILNTNLTLQKLISLKLALEKLSIV